MFMAWIEINKNNLFHNLDYFSSLVGGKEKLAVGLKDNAYGHGIVEIAQLCRDYGISNVFVKNDIEASMIEHLDFDSVLILYGIGKIEYTGSRRVAILSLEQLHKLKKNSNIELKIDTGMHRNGILPCEIDEAIKTINDRYLNLEGIFTHFLSADENNKKFIRQETVLKNCVKKISKSINTSFRVHCANTCGSHKVDVNEYDLFRVGIGTYGYIDIELMQGNLKPVMSLIAEKISTRKIAKQETVGYGSTAYINEYDELTVSCYDIGYGDGFFRLNESKKYRIDDGREILGRVSMDSLSIEGNDECIRLFNDVSRLARVHNTITYEILTALSPTLKRIVVE